MSDKIISLIRTAVPAAVAPLLVSVTAWLVGHGIKVDLTGWTTIIAAAAVSAAVTAYYAVVRAAEKKFPWVGKLLGVQAQVTYTKPTVVPTPAPATVVPAPPAADTQAQYTYPEPQ